MKTLKLGLCVLQAICLYNIHPYIICLLTSVRRIHLTVMPARHELFSPTRDIHDPYPLLPIQSPHLCGNPVKMVRACAEWREESDNLDKNWMGKISVGFVMPVCVISRAVSPSNCPRDARQIWKKKLKKTKATTVGYGYSNGDAGFSFLGIPHASRPLRYVPICAGIRHGVNWRC